MKIAAADAYGEYDKTLLQRVPRRALKGVGNLQVGMQLHTQSAHGVRAVIVTQIQGDMVTIDGNHPLAGQNLNFDVEIAEVRRGDRGRAGARPRPWGRAGTTTT